MGPEPVRWPRQPPGGIVRRRLDPAYKAQAGAELFDPSTGVWTATASLSVATMWPAIEVLPDGKILIAGGGLSATADRVTAVCEIYTPAVQ